MVGCRSQNPELIPFNHEPTRILPFKTPPSRMAEDIRVARPTKEYFTPSTYNTISCIRIPNMGANHYEIKFSVITFILWTYK